MFGKRITSYIKIQYHDIVVVPRTPPPFPKATNFFLYFQFFRLSRLYLLARPRFYFFKLYYYRIFNSITKWKEAATFGYYYTFVGQMDEMFA